MCLGLRYLLVLIIFLTLSFWHSPFVFAAGVVGESSTGHGVVGVSSSEGKAGVYAENPNGYSLFLESGDICVRSLRIPINFYTIYPRPGVEPISGYMTCTYDGVAGTIDQSDIIGPRPSPYQINNPYVKEDSIIILTPIWDSDDPVRVWVKEKHNGYFTVGIYPSSISIDRIKINYLVIN